MNVRLYKSASELKGFSVKNCPSMPLPGAVLMCEPKYYDVSEGRNPFMSASIGKVDSKKAMAQAMKERGIETAKLAKGARGFKGITLKVAGQYMDKWNDG